MHKKPQIQKKITLKTIKVQKKCTEKNNKKKFKSPRQELKEDPHSGSYNLVVFNLACSNPSSVIL